MSESYDRLYGGKSDEEALALLRSQSHGQLSLWNAKTRQPLMVFMPYVVGSEARSGEQPRDYNILGHSILGHLANSNPCLKILAGEPRATFWVEGPSAYIPSYWVDPRKGVPTNYYSWAQFETEVTIVPEQEGIMKILEAMLATLQPEGREPPMNMEDKYWQGMVGAITGLRLKIVSCASRHKYGQNRNAETRGNIVERLRERAAAGDLAVAEKVLEHLNTG